MADSKLQTPYANIRFPYHFYQPTQLKVNFWGDPGVEQLKIHFSFQDAYKMQMAHSHVSWSNGSNFGAWPIRN